MTGVTANFDSGVLKLVMPKHAVEKKKIHIEGKD
jgi:HSP20 family molecular chaperone IbpA